MRTLPEHCPALHELQRFAVGDLPSHDCEIISAHLPQCNDCIERVVSFQNDGDGLIAALRTVPEASLLNEQDAERINALVERIASTSFQQRNDAHQLEFEPGEMVDEYEILERLPGGGMGRVYRVRHRTLGKIFALKIIRKEFDDHQRATARFRREILAGGMLNHPNIVQATDARVVNGQTILVMEFVDGMDIAKLLKRATTIEIADACEIGRQACLGLQHAHGRGYIHRDIKPSNLILGRDGKVKILDLGLIRLLEPDDNSEAISEVGSFLGTPEYTSPEQARGGPLAASTDCNCLPCPRN